MSDLSSEDEKEVKALKEALHLNLAMCYIKLEEWKKAKASCDSALEFNETVKGTVCVCVRACVCGCTCANACSCACACACASASAYVCAY